MNLRILLSIICIVLVQAYSVAQDVQARAQALLQHARQLSDIRSLGAPAFRLKATFSFVGDSLETVQVTYTETWFSDSQWRRETVIGDLRYIEVGGADKRWLVYPDGFPAKARHLAALMAASPPASDKLEFDSISEQAIGKVSTACAITTPHVDEDRPVFCFEKKSGVLLQKLVPEKRPRNVVAFSCNYGTFKKFGKFWFPQEVLCFEDRHKSISAHLTDLTMGPPAEAALFEPPAGSIELLQCFGRYSPTTLSGDWLLPPSVDRDRIAWIKLWFATDSRGKVKEVRALGFTPKGSLEKALDRVRSWHFNPGKCDGKPITTEATMEIPYVPE